MFRSDARPELTFAGIALRFGPEPAYKRISPLADWKVGDERRAHWREMPQSLDATRIPIWDHRAKVSERPDLLAYESSDAPWCLILQPAAAAIEWAAHVRLALKSLDKPDIPLKREPLVLNAEAVLSDNVKISDAVRALCAADIVVVDVTGYDPGVLLLLGIRAAVRRSVTIVCTQQERSSRLWDDLPFNLRELNLVSFHDEAHSGPSELLRALRAGLTQSDISPRYLDLPVYDYVRANPGETGTVDPAWVLLLRAFKLYTGARSLHVAQRIRSGLGLPTDARIEAVIDQVSPRLAGQRLYEAIRHWHTCVVDLTWWRPNVLFELGVRLAVRPDRTFSLLDTTQDEPAAPESSKARLKELLRPITYQVGPGNLKFNDHVPPIIYEAAAQHFRTWQDYDAVPVDRKIESLATEALGRGDPLQAVDLRSLYADENVIYASQVRHSALDALSAAWCCLAEHDEPHRMRPVDLLDPAREDSFRQFQRLSSNLQEILSHLHGDRYDRLRSRIAVAITQASRSGTATVADLLGAWKASRSAPLWSDTTTSGEKQDVIDDCEYQLSQLEGLEGRLGELASPACEIMLQGVRSDQRRLRNVLRQMQRGG